jgi:mannose-6-phosphate isomerase-like protein (cupin superfamily)
MGDSPDNAIASNPGEAIHATGRAFEVHEWSHGAMAGPPLHVHHHDDEAWYVLEGTLHFELGDRSVDVGAGGCMLVPGGVPHSFGSPGNVRYLIITTPRILALIDALHAASATIDEAAIYRQFDSEIVG